MNWNNLKDGLCAKCSMKLKMGLLDVIYECSNCDFRISREKWEQITTPKSFKRNDDNIDNLAALNNYGHDLITEDFSDSPFRK